MICENLISIIVPVFNTEIYLEKCIKSLCAQTYENIEILLIDDGSTDSSGAICDEFENREKKIRAIHKKNGGPSSARNTGIEEAKGEYITFVDADDYVSPQYIENLYESVLKKDLVCAGYIDISRYGKYEHTDFIKEGDKKKLSDDILTGTGGVPWGKLYRKEIINENRIRFNSNVIMSEDLLFLLDYVNYVREYKYTAGKYYIYNRLNEKGISRNISNKYLESYEIFFWDLEEKLRKLEYSQIEIERISNKKVEHMICEILMSSRNIKQNYASIIKNERFKQVIKENENSNYIIQCAKEKKWYRIYLFQIRKKIKYYCVITWRKITRKV